MTAPEREALLAHPGAAGISAQFDVSEHGQWVAMKAGPCPFYVASDKSCRVYEARPYNCRRFQCGRWDPASEPFRLNPMPIIRSNNDLRWSYRKNQAAHQEWANAHGWSPE